MSRLMNAAPNKPRARASLASQTQELKRNLQTPIPAPRIALERKISLRFPHFQGFLTECSSNISITGMFVKARFPQKVGTILDFEFNLIDGLQLIRGTGEVIWRRRKDQGPEVPAGMGIRFLRLDPDSRRLIRWAVEKQINEGVETFDLDASQAREIAAEAPPPETGSTPRDQGELPPTGGEDVDLQKLYPYAGYAAAPRSDWRRRWAPAASGLASVVLLSWAAYFSRPSGGAVAPGDTAEPAAPAVSAVVSAPDIAPAGAPAERQLVDAAEAWARAWAEQRPDDYLLLYSPRFSPPRSSSRPAWEAERRDRITRPRFIQVGISDLEIELESPRRGRVSFEQSYRSDRFGDVTRKTLELVREDGRWMILEERAAPRGSKPAA